MSLLVPGTEYFPSMMGLLERVEGVIPEEVMKELEAGLIDLPISAIVFALLSGPASGISINSVVALGEELGWRGFLFGELNLVGFWESSSLIGLIWGLWHTPFILQGLNCPQHPIEGVFMMALFYILLSPVFNFIRLRSNSVLAAAIFHGTLNGTDGISIVFVKGGSDLMTGMTGITGLGVLAIMNAILYLTIKTSRPKINNPSRSPWTLDVVHANIFSWIPESAVFL